MFWTKLKAYIQLSINIYTFAFVNIYRAAYVMRAPAVWGECLTIVMGTLNPKP